MTFTSSEPPPQAHTSAAQASEPRDGLRDFWRRVSEGLELQELWTQFSREAQASYGLYSKEVDWEGAARKRGVARAFHIARAFFWAMLMKLSPARRVVLLLALVLLLIGGVQYRFEGLTFGFRPSGIGVAILLVLLALELADRVTMKRDLEIARDIQRWLVPEAPPQVAGLDMAFATRPANTVAGDSYDAFFRGGDGGGKGKLLLAVADVAGKSVPAALLMATFQAGLHALATASASLPELCDRLNQFVWARSLGGQRFTTAFLAELDPQTREFTFINAGHNAPVLRRVSGALERLEAGGVPFGVLPEARYECGRASLGRGDVLLVFTDGLVEAVDARGAEYGEGNLLYLLNTVPGESAGETVRHLLEDVNRFAGAAPQHDDMTCLVVRAV